MSLRKIGKVLGRRKHVSDEAHTQSNLRRCLSTLDLTLLGVGSTLGLGIYILAGQIASQTAGPAVAISFLIAALASVFSALCYAEFGARVPKAGSAYVYSYVSVGEFMAFIIGWNLILEYVIGTASVARGYSGYIDSLFDDAMGQYLNRTVPMHVPALSDFPDLFAFGITLIMTVMLSIGVKESTGFNNIFTIINILVVLFAVISGCFEVSMKNWQLEPAVIPAKHGKGGFFPYGFHGVMSGAATAFYGYVGFDCIATTGEEAKNPKRAIPISIGCSLFIVFCAYFSVSTIQTLMWPYYDQYQPAPLPYVFKMVKWHITSWIISVGALVGLSTSLLGAMFPLPRILYAMSDDGLIFKFFSKIHERFKTPLLATLASGVFAGAMAMMFDIRQLANMMSIGTLLAFTLVAVSVLILRYRLEDEGKATALIPDHPNGTQQSSMMEGSDRLDSSPGTSAAFANDELYRIRKSNSNENSIATSTKSIIEPDSYTKWQIWVQIFNSDGVCVQTPLSSTISMHLIYITGGLLVILDVLLTSLEGKLVALDVASLASVGVIFLLVCIAVTALARQPSDQQNLYFKVPGVPYVPILSVFVNVYLMLKLPIDTWYRFAGWMTIGFIIYFAYGIRHSKERVLSTPAPPPSKSLPAIVESDAK